MYEWERMRRKAAMFKEMYPVGTRIELDHMEDPWAPVPEGTRGTVVAVDDIGQLHMKWDNGRTLAVVPGVDSFRKLTTKELEEEQVPLDRKLDDAVRESERFYKDGAGKGNKEREFEM